jgi:heme oxygenase
VADALGYVYVIEGSTLGGQVVLRDLGTRLSLTPEESAFLRSYGAEVGRMWREVLAWLGQAMADPAAEAAITTTAQETFSRLAGWYRADPRFR